MGRMEFSNKTDKIESYRATEYYYFPSDYCKDLVIGWYNNYISSITIDRCDLRHYTDTYINHLTGRWLKRAWGNITFNAHYRFVKDNDLIIVCDPEPVAVILSVDLIKHF